MDRLGELLHSMDGMVINGNHAERSQVATFVDLIEEVMERNC